VRIRSFILFTAGWIVLTAAANAQAAAPSASPPTRTDAVNDLPPNEPYTPPSRQVQFRNYAFDLLGPYPFITSAGTAGIHQATDNPPEWGQGLDGYMRRLGSSYGISVVETSTRYGLAAALRDNTLYYPCTCSGFGKRLEHAVISSFTDRRGADGHRVVSIPAIVAPYAGTFTATYAWYPRQHYGTGDALLMGTNGLLAYVGGNIALEFLYNGPHSLLARAHLPVMKSSGEQNTQPAQNTQPQK
jgi:hypothetical protein